MFLGLLAGLPTRPYLPVLVWKSAGSTEVRPYFSKYGVSRKYGNCDVNECEFVASEVDLGIDGELLFVDMLKYTAGPEWSKEFIKPMNIDFALKLYES